MGNIELPETSPRLPISNVAIESSKFCLKGLDLLQEALRGFAIGDRFDQVQDPPLHIRPPPPNGLQLLRIFGETPPDGLRRFIEHVAQGLGSQHGGLDIVEERGIEFIDWCPHAVGADGVPPLDVEGTDVPGPGGMVRPLPDDHGPAADRAMEEAAPQVFAFPRDLGPPVELAPRLAQVRVPALLEAGLDGLPQVLIHNAKVLAVHDGSRGHLLDAAIGGPITSGRSPHNLADVEGAAEDLPHRRPRPGAGAVAGGRGADTREVFLQLFAAARNPIEGLRDRRQAIPGGVHPKHADDGAGLVWLDPAVHVIGQGPALRILAPRVDGHGAVAVDTPPGGVTGLRPLEHPIQGSLPDLLAFQFGAKGMDRLNEFPDRSV